MGESNEEKEPTTQEERADRAPAEAADAGTATDAHRADADTPPLKDASNGDGGERPRGRRRRRRPRGPGPSYVPEDDERADKALAFLSDLIQKMDMDCTVRLVPPKEGRDGEIGLEIHGEDAGRVIGKKGQVLSAIQFITNRVVNRPGLEKRHILVDAEGYRRRRESSLASMARRLGKQAVSDGKIITFEPMNPRDRRVVHLALAKFEGVVTKSEGEGDDRRVQIIPVRR